MIKLALGVEYDGSKYYGWESQIKGYSIKEKLESAISRIANHKISVICAGRTDSGVHAYNQVIHFETCTYRKNFTWLIGINSLLPKDISIKWIKNVLQDFHARYSAISRSYRYIIYNNFIRSALLRNRVNNIFFNLNVKKMNRASKFLLGENDFSSFRASKCQSYSSWRNIFKIKVYKKNNFFIIIDITANSFLYKMVRNIVGCLIEIGRNKKNELWLFKVLHLKNRIFSGPTALANGLYLLSVEYPKRFKIFNRNLDYF